MSHRARSAKWARRARWVPVVIVTLASAHAACGQDGASRRFNRNDHSPVQGWILLDGNRDHVSEVLARAPEFGVTQVQLSHDLIMDIDEITEDEARAAFLQDIAREAKGYGLEVLVWAHELTGNRLQVCFHPGDPFWEERREAYRQAFERIPELNGVVLTFGSAAPDPWFAFCQCPDPAVHAAVCVPEHPTGPFPEMEAPAAPERVRLVTDTVADVTAALGKRLLVRTFVHSAEQLQWVGEGLRLVADRDFTVMSKDVPQDFEPYYPHNALIGAVRSRPHVAELDLAGQYWGQAQLLNPQVDYLVYRFRYLWGHQGIGIAGRVERGNRYVLGTPNEVNLFAVSRLVADPATTPAALYDAWLEARYGLAPGAPAAAALAEVLRLSWEATRKRHYVLGFWALEKDTELPPEIRTEQLSARALSKYEEGFEDLFASLEAPTPDVLRAIHNEGEEAVAAARLAEARFAADVAAALLSAGLTADASDLGRRLRHQTLACEAWLWAEEALWGDKLLTNTRDPRHRAWLEHALVSLAGVAARIEADLGPGGPYALPGAIWPAAPGRLAELLAAFRARYPVATAPAPEARAQLLIGVPAVTDLTATGATVTFETNAKATCDLAWGTVITRTPNTVDGDGVPATTHTFALSHLEADALHLVRLICTPAAGAPDAGAPLPGGDWYLFTPAALHP